MGYNNCDYLMLSELKVVVELESQQGQQNDSSVIDQLNDF